MTTEAWPVLPSEEWADTIATLHLWLQVVGKIRLAQAPMVNHWWQVALYVTPRGLTTSAIPYRQRAFQIDFDFIDHVLNINECDGMRIQLVLEPMSVARFYHSVMESLTSMGIDIPIRTMPCEIADAVPFDRDEVHTSYDPDHAHRFWRALLQADRLAKIFRGRFIGKVSPVHVFWGAPDLAVTRFSGRRAPPHPGGIPNMGDWVTREAYSHEVSSAGWWPGVAGIEPMFYSYAYPAPEGFATARIEPSAAFYHEQLREFVLPYEKVRASNDPDAMVLAFFQSTYEAAANLAAWDRAALER
ncbi:MAG TPA: DUF5996 family protein [Candidatus Baltobacteraceae bacterium]